MSNLVDHARRELELCGQAAEDPAYAASIIRTVEAFASFGHSGMSAMMALEQLDTLLRFRNLSPLTDDPAEWVDQSDVTGEPCWQSRRNYEAFSADGGRNYWLLSEGATLANPAPLHASRKGPARNESVPGGAS